MQLDTPRFSEWLAAERDAYAAECELHSFVIRLSTGSSDHHLTERVLRTREKRATAHSLFEGAMQEMKACAEWLHYRRILGTGSEAPEEWRMDGSARDLLAAPR